MFQGPFSESIVKRAIEDKYIQLNFIQIRDFGIGKHQEVDDRPFGGGIGMVMRVDVLEKAIEKTRIPGKKEKVILLSAKGQTFTQQMSMSFAKLDHLILICGHYEGVDERILHFIDGQVSIGDFIVTGGEIPSMLIIDAVTRLIPGVLKSGATEHESFSKLVTNDSKAYLEYPQYTRPDTFKKLHVPDILLSGNHKEIQLWREKEAKRVTKVNRPDLLVKKNS